jgi:CHAT domain-containing protein
MHNANDTLPHITWCPTGPLAFLPLHAAGIYRQDGRSECAMDVVVSSYTPTLEALLRLSKRTALSSEDPKILIVSQPETPGQQPIPGTEKEAAVIQSIFPQSTTLLNRDKGTIAMVLEGIKTHSWVHLACHGIQDSLDSAFLLEDGKLKLSTLMTQSLPHAEIAFLSACQTASGDEQLPEEAVHLAAGMLNVGYKSVIGTMWSISDLQAIKVAEKFYEATKKQLMDGKELRPAYALHEATQHLRNTVGVFEFLQWIPFVHFGF